MRGYWLPVAVAALVAAVLGLGFGLDLRWARFGVAARMEVPARVSLGPGPLEWHALITLGWTAAAVLGYSAFFYHYADFTAPWLAIASGYTAGAMWPQRTRRALAVAAAALALVASFEAWD